MTTGGRGNGSLNEDELLSRLYQQVTQQQAARFAAGFDIANGLDRYRTWLLNHTAQDPARLDAIPANSATALRASIGSAGVGTPLRGPSDVVSAAGTTPEPAGTRTENPEVWAVHDADRALTALYSTHYRPLVRLAALLVGDIATAEGLVQDSFVAMHSAWPRLADSDRALFYLRQSVLKRSRSVQRHSRVVAKLARELPGCDREAMMHIERSALVSALRALPTRQREVLVLRYYADLSETETASAMGMSKGAVKSHTARAMSSLRAELRRADV